MEHVHMKILDLSSNTCLNGSENRESEPSNWGLKFNTPLDNILLLNFFFGGGISSNKTCGAEIALIANFRYFVKNSNILHTVV